MRLSINRTLALITLLSIGFTNPVYAENQALMALLEALHKNGTIDAGTYQLIQQLAKQENQQTAPSQASTRAEVTQIVEEKIAQATKDKVQINTKGKFSVKSHDGDFEFRLGGRIQMDAATYSEDQSRQNDGTELRRVRLFAQGRMWHDWKYKLQYEFTGNGINGIQDAYIDYLGYKPVSIKLGHFKEAFSLQNMTSSKYVPFTERALLSAFAPGRNIGIQVATKGDNWTLAAGLFGQGRDGASSDNDEGYGFASRGTYSPMLGDNTRLHLGLGLGYRHTGSVDAVRFRERPESHVTNKRLLDTGNIDTDSFTRIGLESALIHGPFSLEAEYNHLMLDRAISGNPDLDFSGYYVQGTWFLTGESPSYKANKGSFSNISPRNIVGKGGLGAWQLALRFSSLDLSDEDVNGGEQKNFSVGLNWYTTPNIRFSANYVNVLEVKGGGSAGDEPDAFQVRAQIEF